MTLKIFRKYSLSGRKLEKKTRKFYENEKTTKLKQNIQKKTLEFESVDISIQLLVIHTKRIKNKESLFFLLLIKFFIP